MARNSIGEPVPGTENQMSVYDKWSSVQSKKKGDSSFMPMNSVNNISTKTKGSGGKGKGGNKGNGGGKGGKGGGKGVKATGGRGKS